MYYFYYFKDTKTNLYYGGITSSIYNRQRKHQRDLNKNLKSNKKPWHLYQDKIQLIVLWSFNTKKEACVYEKQWIINNYLNPLCLNCSVSNSEYDYKNHKDICKIKMSSVEHQKLSETNGGCKAKVRYALEVNNTSLLHTFKSSFKAAKFTGVSQAGVSASCKTAKPYNSGSGRWLFSDVSEADLISKFNNLARKEIRGNCNQPFILINKNTGEQSSIFYSTLDPKRCGYNVPHSHLSCCLNGSRKSVGGYYAKVL